MNLSTALAYMTPHTMARMLADLHEVERTEEAEEVAGELWTAGYDAMGADEFVALVEAVEVIA